MLVNARRKGGREEGREKGREGGMEKEKKEGRTLSLADTENHPGTSQTA